uniref:NADH dehydrogenase subunit 2 n=1 Tax=Asparagopsis taxiformis TaxID=260499 RepID=A0A0E3DB44_9FLOR|nr:NADH dehydrogenase subunit 2 [Asparagopsis taxiformis]AHX02410.1 NADH dehydrogenase subunit 2 [Asparagopsis taxiformis]
MSQILYNIYPILTEIYLLFNINFLLMYGVFFSSSSKYGYPLLITNIGWLVFQLTFFSILLIVHQVPLNFLIWNNLLVSNLFTNNLKILILLAFLILFILTLIYSIHEKINAFEYWILFLLSIVALLMATQSYDLLTIYISIEFQSLIFYILATFKRTSEFSTEAGLKYFILGAFSSALLLFGSALLYSLTGLTNLGDFSKFFIDLNGLEPSFLFGSVISLTFIIIALLFKLSAAPFHIWTPDVYEGSPTSITAFFSFMPKLVILTLLLRLLVFSFQDFIYLWKNIILICSLLSLLIGALGAFSQKKWKRFIAYSSINHIGFFLLAILTVDFDAVSSIIIYIISYIIMVVGLFSIVLNLRYYKYPYTYQIRNLQDIIFLSKVNPVLSLALSLILFSMAGVPPLIGFFSKFFILFSAIQKNILGNSLLAVLISCITCFYYIRLIKLMYFDTSRYWTISLPLTAMSAYLLIFFVYLLSFLFLDLEILSLLATKMSLSFLN